MNAKPLDKMYDEIFAWEAVKSDGEQDSPKYIWDGCYSAIATCNQALKAIEQLEAQGINMDCEKGEALISRAYHHFILVTVESTYTPLSDTGYWCVYWACDPEDYAQSLSIVRHELDKLRTVPLTESGLRHALDQLRGQLAISAQNQENSALAMAKSMLYHGAAPSWQETLQKIEQTTILQLQQVAKEVFDDTNTYILTYE